MQLNDFSEILKEGEKNAVNSIQLFRQYKREGGTEQSLSLFRRYLRLQAVKLRKEGIKVIGDNNGYYIAQNKQEWENYTNTQLHSAYSKILAIAICEKLTVSQLIRKRLSKKDLKNQLKLFNV